MIVKAGVYRIDLQDDDDAENFWSEVDEAGIRILDSQSLVRDGKWVTLVKLPSDTEVPDNVLAYGWSEDRFDDLGAPSETHGQQITGSGPSGAVVVFAGVTVAGLLAAWMKRKKR